MAMASEIPDRGVFSNLSQVFCFQTLPHIEYKKNNVTLSCGWKHLNKMKEQECSVPSLWRAAENAEASPF